MYVLPFQCLFLFGLSILLPRFAITLTPPAVYFCDSCARVLFFTVLIVQLPYFNLLICTTQVDAINCFALTLLVGFRTVEDFSLRIPSSLGKAVCPGAHSETKDRNYEVLYSIPSVLNCHLQTQVCTVYATLYCSAFCYKLSLLQCAMMYCKNIVAFAKFVVTYFAQVCMSVGLWTLPVYIM